ncbi:MAG: TolC family protein [Flavobacteriaceae bacterium]
MNRLRNILCCFLLLANGYLNAQEKWSLEACINYALEHNLTLNNLKLTIDSTKETYKQSYRNLLPSISGNSSYNIRFGRSVDPNNNEIISSDFFSNSYSLNASLDIFRSFQKINGIKAANFLYKATKEEQLQEKYLLAFRVMSAFYDIQFFEGLLLISKQQEKISLKNLTLVKKQIQLGLKAGVDIYEAESLLTADQLKVTQNENSLKAAKLQLIQEMNLKNTSTIDINVPLETDTEDVNDTVINSSDLYIKSLEFIPIIKAQELRVKAAKKDISIARANLMPSLTISGGYGTGFFETNTDASGEVIPFRTQIKENASQFIGLSLRIPISSGWSARSRIKQQKIALERAGNDLEIQKQALNTLIQELVQGYRATKKEVVQAEQNEKSRFLAFSIAQKRFDKGLINTIELFQSKNLYETAQNENLQIKLKMKVQKKTIDFYQGLPVFKINKTN